VLKLALLFPMVASAAICQETKLSDTCDLSVLGARDTKGFLAFDKELRAAIARQDPVALAFLVKFPLRVNSYTGKYSLDDPAALQSHFQKVFPLAVRSAILDQKLEDFFCNYEGVSYGSGEVWVNPTRLGYAINVVNLRSEAQSARAVKRQMDFICRTEKYRIAVDSDDRGARYRTWNLPHPISAVPDLEIRNGVQTFEGTGLCGGPVWTFTNGKATYRVEGGFGCVADDNAPPKDATGRLEVLVAGQEKLREWCY